MLGNPDSGIREIFLVRFLVKQFASTNQRHPNLGSGTSSGFPQVARDFSKSCSKVAKIKSNLLFESKFAQKK